MGLGKLGLGGGFGEWARCGVLGLRLRVCEGFGPRIIFKRELKQIDANPANLSDLKSILDFTLPTSVSATSAT